MIFNSFQFLWLFPLIFAFHWGASAFLKGTGWQRWSNAMLLITSYLVYLQYKPAYALLLLGVTAITYGFARLIEGSDKARRRYWLVWAGGFLAVLPLLVFKYYNFLNDTFASCLRMVGVADHMPGLNWALPLGISFFTFIALGYLFDVYYGRIRAERNWWHYMLFVSFFPQIAAGPISKAADVLPQIKRPRVFDNARAVEGARWFLWGLFLKVALADNLGLFVDKSLRGDLHQSGLTSIFTAVVYSFQIYGDFAGYSFMAIGTARLLGFDLINNFRRPYLSVSVTDFWRRWHISLSTWLKDYVYIPLGGSRCSKARNYLNIMVTFFVSGIWHGANWTYIVWGLFHGLCQVIEKALGQQRYDGHNPLVRAGRIILTFAIITVAWVFFRLPTIGEGWAYLCNFVTPGPIDISYAGDKWKLYATLTLGIVVVTDLCEEFFPRVKVFANRRRWVRWSAYLALLVIIVLCGVLDAGQFIYVSF